jgi:DNA-binding response OmpR family regulator
METNAELRMAVVIEDEDDIRHLLETVLTQAGFMVVATSNGLDGLAAVRKHEPVVTTLDVNMPGMDGFETARRIREFSSTYIVMLTALNEEIDTLQGLEAGADDYVNKPFRPRELRARIEAMLRRPRTTVTTSTTPEQAAPIQAAPVQQEPVQAAPMQQAPVQQAPVQQAPVQNQPYQVPAQDQPYQVQPQQTQPYQAQPQQTQPYLTQPYQTQPAQAPVQPQAPAAPAAFTPPAPTVPEIPVWPGQNPVAASAPVAAPAPQVAASEVGGSWLEHNGLRLNVDSRVVKIDDREIELTRSEFDLLVSIIDSHRRVKSKADLVLLLRGESYVTSHFVSDADKRAIEVHMANLRKKLGDNLATPRWIETVRGVGYRLTATDS